MSRGAIWNGERQSHPRSSFPEEADPFNAKRAIQEGDECGVGYFARDHAEALSLLADLFDPPQGTARKLEFVSQRRQRPKADDAARRGDVSDWQGTLDQVKAAIETGSLTLIGSYLREAAGVYRRVADALDPPSGSRGRRLKFVRQGPGRRADPLKMIADSKIKMLVAFAKRRSVKLGKSEKLEAAVADAAAQLGISAPASFVPSKEGRSSRKSGN